MYDEFTYAEKQLLSKLARFCSYRDRSQGEVRQKMNALGISSDKYKKFISYLEEEKYLDEERFCEVYVRSKLLHNQWGRQKIYAGLKNKFVDSHYIENALKSLDTKEYIIVLNNVLEKKLNELEFADPKIRKQKTIRYALSKGFTFNEIMEHLKEIK